MHNTVHKKPFVVLASIIVLLALLVALPARLLASQPAQRLACGDIFFSEYIEGSGNNKAIEIFNGTGAAVDLSAYTVELYSNGATDVTNSLTMSGTLAVNDVYVISNSGAADATIIAESDTTSTVTFYNGDDALVLKKGLAVIDSIGRVGTDPGAEWGVGLQSTQNNTIRRMNTIVAGDTDVTDAYSPVAEWDGFDIDDVVGLGSHAAPGCGGGPVLNISKTVSPDMNVAPSSLVTYTIVLESSGAEATATVTDSLPAEVLFTNWIEQPAGADVAANELTWTGSVSGTAPVTFTFQVSNTAGSGTVVNSAEFSGPNSGSASASFSAFTPGAQAVPYSENYDSCTTVPAGWTIFSVDADTANTWNCNNGDVQVNAFGDSAAGDEWLISPPIDLDMTIGEVLSFTTWTRFADTFYPPLVVKYSSDYSGSGDPSGATWTDLTGYALSPEGSQELTASGMVDISDITGAGVYFAFQYTSTGTGGGDTSWWRVDDFNIVVPTFDVVINEFQADPAGDITGDANGDGVRDSSEDEFIEIFNNNGGPLDISGWTLSDAVQLRHTFPANTIIPDQCAVVVFGGGSPTGTFGDAIVQTATEGQVGLNNSGDTITLARSGAIVAQVIYGSEGSSNQSLTLDPDITGVTYVTHTSATGAAGALFSPGTLIDGSNFSGCVPVVNPGITTIPAIQGNGAASTFVGQSVTTVGVVTADFQEDNLNGFFLQDEAGDGDVTTSDGIFVDEGASLVEVAVGDTVTLTADVVENNDMTTLNNISAVTVASGGGDVIPPPSRAPIAPTLVTLPLASYDDFEQYEGMLLTFDTLFVTDNFSLGRYGQLGLVPNDRTYQFTHTDMPDAAGYTAHQELVRASTIRLDDATDIQNVDAPYPTGGLSASNTVRGGDSIVGLTGVLNYRDFGNFSSSPDDYVLEPVGTVTFTSNNPRPAALTTPVGEIAVASFNALNFFTTLDGNGSICGPSSDADCRGADSASEFTRQRAKLVDALVKMDADVIGLMEIENSNDDAALQSLVDGMNAELGGTDYSFIATGAIGTDAIRVGFIYNTTTVTPDGAFQVIDSGVYPGFDITRNRPTLAQTFIEDVSSGKFTVAVNHLKSKGSGCGTGDDDTATGQGNCNGTRTAAAEAMATWLETIKTATNDTDVLIIGDLNSYRMEDPIVALEDAGYTDLSETFLGRGGGLSYGYVFRGEWGYLDYAMASDSMLAQVAGVVQYNINSDEPISLDYNEDFKSSSQIANYYAADAYRSSDHDPVVVRLTIGTTSAVTLADVATPAAAAPVVLLLVLLVTLASASVVMLRKRS